MATARKPAKAAPLRRASVTPKTKPPSKPPLTTVPITPYSGAYAPGTYRNAAGYLVDENGVLLSFKELRKRDDDKFEDALGTTSRAETPLDLMLGVMKDPSMPIAVRMDMAVKAAPFVHKRMPMVVETEEQPNMGLNVDMVALAKLSKTERSQFLEMLKKLGVKL